MGLPTASSAGALGPAATGSSRTLADWEPHPRVIPDDESEYIREVSKDVAPNAALYVETYLRTGNHSAASAILGMSPSTSRYWRRQHPEYSALFEHYGEEIRDRWNAVAQAKAMEGFQEWMYDGKGELKGTRTRQDPAFVRAVLGSIDPDRWGKEDKAQSITVNVVQVAE